MQYRNYQNRINAASAAFFDDKSEFRAQVYAPTGAGKTVCFTHLIAHAINCGAKNIAIAHPRIALSQDQVKRLQKDFGSSVHISTFHSGKNNFVDPIKGVSTTNVAELSAVVDNASRPHITFSTYHSFAKLNDAKIKFDLIICDEAHYCVNDSFAKLLATFNSEKVIFYTATPIDRDDVSMSLDLALFGRVIAAVTPSEVIKPGYIVAPMVQLLDCDSTRHSNKADVVDIVKRAYVEQYKVTKQWGMPYHQMLVVARDVKFDLTERLLTADGMSEIKSFIYDKVAVPVNAIDIYVISSQGNYCNGRYVESRSAALDQLKSSRRNAIVCHYDTLAEGIDIDTLSGCVIMRELSNSKYMQTIGRCARPFKDDLGIDGAPKAELYNLDVLVDNRKKPRCIVTIPVVDNEVIAGPKFEKVTEAFIYGGYGDIFDYIPNIDVTMGTSEDKNNWLDNNELEFATIKNHTVSTLFSDIRYFREDSIDEIYSCI